jgi:hypothetical protein
MSATSKHVLKLVDQDGDELTLTTEESYVQIANPDGDLFYLMRDDAVALADWLYNCAPEGA